MNAAPLSGTGGVSGTGGALTLGALGTGGSGKGGSGKGGAAGSGGTGTTSGGAVANSGQLGRGGAVGADGEGGPLGTELAGAALPGAGLTGGAGVRRGAQALSTASKISGRARGGEAGILVHRTLRRVCAGGGSSGPRLFAFGPAPSRPSLQRPEPCVFLARRSWCVSPHRDPKVIDGTMVGHTAHRGARRKRKRGLPDELVEQRPAQNTNLMQELLH